VAAVERGPDQVEPALDQLAPVADPLLLLPQRLAKCAKVVERRWPLVLDVVSGHGTLPKRTVPFTLWQVRARTSVVRWPIPGDDAYHPAMPASPSGAAPRRRRESKVAKLARTAEIRDRMAARYPQVTTALDYRSAWELLVATILSAQSTDVVVNQVTPELFRRYPTVADLAAADPAEVEVAIHATGFFRNKARSIQGAAAYLLEHHGGEVPETIDELVELPGVGRKTANVVLGTYFSRNEGVVVDTHVGRLSRRLGLTTNTDPVKVERDLMALVPMEEWTIFSHRLIWFGREVCSAKDPRCDRCELADLCPSAFKVGRFAKARRGPGNPRGVPR
jgi:endonuclease III